jgi:hypothetical protein
MRYFLLFLGFLILLIGSSFALLRFGEANCLNTTGQIGDTIGGLTAPIINIVGSILIYASFVAQNKANKILADQNSFSAFHEMYKDVKHDFNSLIFYSSSYKEGKQYFGKKALGNFTTVLESRINSNDFVSNSFFDEIQFVMGNILFVGDVIDKSDLNQKEKQYLFNMLDFFYSTKVEKHITKIIELTNDNSKHRNFNIIIKAIHESFKKLGPKYSRI